jgi:hypothetical protein
MARNVTITWALTPEEHAGWLAQARGCGFSVGEYIYALATCHLIDMFPVGRMPRTMHALRESLIRARWYRTRRTAR